MLLTLSVFPNAIPALSKYFKKSVNKEYIGMDEFRITGMSCSSCASTIKDSVSKIDGIESVEIDFTNNLLYVKGNYDRKKVIEKKRKINKSL